MDVVAMSLINSMLREIDARSSVGQGVPAYESPVRAVPVKEAAMPARKWMAWAGGVVLLLAAVLLGVRLGDFSTLARQAQGPKDATAVASKAAAESTGPTLSLQQSPVSPVGITSMPTALQLKIATTIDLQGSKARR
jgi:hypothetical protein